MGVEVVCDIGSNWRAAGEALPQAHDRLLRTLDAIKGAGADTAKFQWLRRTVYPAGSAEAALVAEYELPEEWLHGLDDACAERDLRFLCTVFEPEHVALLDHYVDRWKISSFEAKRTDLRHACRQTGKPLIVSSGTLGELAMLFLAANLGSADTLLLCVSRYPADPWDYDLSVMVDRDDEARHLVGLSDHTAGTHTTGAVMAVALGATMIETHVVLDSGQGSPDASFARTPLQLKRYVKAIREAQSMLGEGVKRVRPGELTHYVYDPATGKRGVA